MRDKMSSKEDCDYFRENLIATPNRSHKKISSILNMIGILELLLSSEINSPLEEDIALVLIFCGAHPTSQCFPQVRTSSLVLHVLNGRKSDSQNVLYKRNSSISSLDIEDSLPPPPPPILC